MYYENNSASVPSGNKHEHSPVVDLRSDTFTKPSKEMREAMFRAEVGDDVYGEDPTVKKLEEAAAKMVGKEAALFICSGTMGNLIAIMNHCNVRGSEAYCGELSHCLLHEQAGASQIGGVSLRPLRNNENGTFDIVELESKLRNDRDHEPISKLVLVENTFDGKIVPQKWINELALFCKKHNLKLHMDGARLWNAVVGSKISASDIVAGCDSVSFCLSKALGAPAGSLLCGTQQFITNARRIRKVLGGGMRQVGVLAAAGLVALSHIPYLAEDHRRAQVLASAINDIKSTVFSVEMIPEQTNMVFVNIDPTVVQATEVAKHLRETDASLQDDVVVKCLALSSTRLRFVLSYETTDNDLKLAIKKIKAVVLKFDSNI